MALEGEGEGEEGEEEEGEGEGEKTGGERERHVPSLPLVRQEGVLSRTHHVGIQTDLRLPTSRTVGKYISAV